MRTRPTLIGAVLLRRGDVDAMLCGTVGTYGEHLRFVREVIGCRTDVKTLAAMNMLMLPGSADLHLRYASQRNPTAEQLAEITVLAADGVRRFGITPRVALLSHSSFGSSDAPEAELMRDALVLIEARSPIWKSRARCRRCRAVGQHVSAGRFRLAPPGRCQSPDHAESGCREHLP